MTSISNAVATRDNGPQALIDQYRSDFALVLPTHIKADQWVRLSQGILRRDKNLARVAQQNPGSFLSALLDCARLGLEPGDTYHLVTFGGEIVGIVDWTGEVELIYRAGAVSSIRAEIVYSGDHFHYEPGTMDRPDHKPDWFGERGEMIGVYAYAVLKDGSTSRVVVMSKADVNRVKAVSKTAKSSSSPWNTWADRMWLKTAVKQLAKWIPSSSEYREQVTKATVAAERVSEKRELPSPAVDHDGDTEPHVDLDTGEVYDAEVVDSEWPPVAEPGAGS